MLRHLCQTQATLRGTLANRRVFAFSDINPPVRVALIAQPDVVLVRTAPQEVCMAERALMCRPPSLSQLSSSEPPVMASNAAEMTYPINPSESSSVASCRGPTRLS